ncbi:hypothetical protein AY601_2007 [Pedobacter cryoconitis]|uniref:LA2681-like HEPN domain-containing protein n=1 Tax=Pedobacter cryoconitis TaxID=188932 RepID=A0A127VC36_9SPHI|nr:LA2681 family HEPN domain-containing protein [Pedobacter cryoconitis]AMP98913.1 hypothetical protein AY601_2007 [Pedobacter cryoconitis]
MKKKNKGIMSVDDGNPISITESIALIGQYFDYALDNGDPSYITRGIALAEKINEANCTQQELITLHYFLSNGWFSLQGFQQVHLDADLTLGRMEMTRGLFHLRRCIAFPGFQNTQAELQCQAYTNLGNHFSHVGQFIEAIQYWRKALEIIPYFPMAMGNMGMGLYRYASAQHLDTHRDIFVHQAYQWLKDGYSLRKFIHPSAAGEFRSLLRAIEKNWPEEFLTRKMDFSFALGKQRKIKEYREWGIANGLYLNPLNDLGALELASHDCLHLPSITVSLDSRPKYHSLYNQLKQEYGTARFLFYEGTQLPAHSYSDKDIKLVDTLDYADYSFNLEKVKIAYRLIYSIFDKIAYFLNDYLAIGIPINQISFRVLWHADRKGETIRPQFSGSSNLALKALYWLSRDLFDKGSNQELLEPEAKELADIRNHIEHRSFKIKQYGNWGEIEDGFTFAIGREEFEQKTLKQLKLARAALIYLSLAIHEEEKHRVRKGHTIPYYLPDMRQDYKI